MSSVVLRKPLDDAEDYDDDEEQMKFRKNEQYLPKSSYFSYFDISNNFI